MCNPVHINLIQNHKASGVFASSMEALVVYAKLQEISAGCPAVREKSGKFQTWQKSGKSQGILLKVSEKNEFWEKSGKSQGICI